MNLKAGDQLISRLDRRITVLGEIARGGQGVVYRVRCAGRDCALKWYYARLFRAPKKKKLFLDNLMENMLSGPPVGAEGLFVWPWDVVESEQHGTFGYVMDLIPESYLGFEAFQGNQGFSSLRTRIDAMINIAQGYRVLHNAGYKYQDINNGNVYIRPRDGAVLICDNDNAARGDKANGVVGKDGYMAPEVTAGIKMPDLSTDRYSLSVLLFLLVCKGHPLIGRRVLDAGVLTEENMVELFGRSPLYIFDPRDDANRPDPQEQAGVIRLWRALPAEVRGAFERSFSQGALRCDPKGGFSVNRLLEYEWQMALLHWRNSLVACTCPGRPEWSVSRLPARCPRCGKPLPAAWMITADGRDLPVAEGMRLTRLELGHTSERAAVEYVLETAPNPKYPGDPAGFALRNLTDRPIMRVLRDGSRKPLEPGKAGPLKDGMTLFCGEDRITVKNCEE